MDFVNSAKYIFLGFIQGVTEFLPVSSSGHLVILKNRLDIQGGNLTLNIILHAGTLLAVVVFFRRDIKKIIKDIPLCKNVIITTIITAIIAVLFKNFFERFFDMPKLAALGLGVTALILFSTFHRMTGKRRISDLNIVDAIVVGVFQAIAITPGISRSGATISAQLWRGIERQSAVYYSFLISIPAVIGAMIMEFPELRGAAYPSPAPLILGFISAFFTGLIAIKILFLVMQKARFPIFGYYCLVMALLAFTLP